MRLAGAEGAASKLWFLLLNMGVAISVGTAVGTATAGLAFPREKKKGRKSSNVSSGLSARDQDRRESLRKVVAAAAAFGNMANLPLVLVSALCSGEGARKVLLLSSSPSSSSFSSSSSEIPSRAQCSARAEEYVMAPIAVA